MSLRLDAAYAAELDRADELAPFRDRFVIADPALIYLDGNSLGRLPQQTAALLVPQVEEAWGERLIRSWNEGWYTLAERIGAKIARLIGARPHEVIVADSTSVNLFKLAVAALQLQAERTTVITDDLNFPSDLYVWEGVVKLLGGGRRLQVIASPDGIFGPMAEIEAALDGQTAVLSLSHTVFKSGFTYDMAAVTERAHAAGALVLWDLSHSAGSVPMALHDWGVDLAVGCTYKYLNGGPGAPAFLYISEALQARLQNPISGWFGQRDPFAFELAYEAAPGLRRFLTGTPPLLSLAAIEPGVDLLLEAGINRLRAKSIRQTEYLIALWQGWLAPLGFRLNSPLGADRRGAHVSLSHPEAWRINRALIEQKQVLPDFRAPDNLRLGVAPIYTSYQEIYAAMDRLRTVVADRIYERYPAARTAVT